MITSCYDETEPMIILEDFYGEKRYLLHKCLIILSKTIHEYLLVAYDCEIVAHLGSCNGSTPIYCFELEGEKIAFYLSSVGSTMASMECVEANWLTGASKFIMFGSCGSLDKDKTTGHYVIPTESYRGDGCSYYYAPPEDYIVIKNAEKVAEFFEKLKVPFVKGRVWTTESILRETMGLVKKRREEGCIAVEMELAGVQAVCNFYHFELYHFLEAGDVLLENGYEVQGLHKANHDLQKLEIALKVLSYI